MFDCPRCGNTGRITEQYADLPPLGMPSPSVGVIAPTEIPIKTRVVECPACLGFSAAPIRPKGYSAHNPKLEQP